MRIRVDSSHFHAQRLRYDLRFCCEDCAHFIGERCAHFWPSEEHRRARYEETKEKDGVLELVFCKEFELR
ncbi:MAG: hypothetical protein JRH20_05910 [Deltaproteobacteria bacterium]|nr:hypothetical protein [Deltaproteobacteria bacterium]